MPASLRLALVSGTLGLGGSTTFLCNLGGELVRRHLAVEAFSFEKDNPLASDFKRLNVPVLSLNERQLIFEDRLQLILQRLSQFKPTAVLANLSVTSFEVLRYVPTGVFRLAVAHTDDPKVYQSLRHYAPHLDLLAVVSETIRQKISQLPEFARVPVRYLPLGVPIPAENTMPVRDFAGPLRILYLGRMDREQKRVHLFPDILTRLCATGIPFHWTIAGEGAERPTLEQTMKSLGANQSVSFPGKIAYADVPRTLCEHDVFLLASDYEGLPLGLLEAMGCGLVPVVSDLPSGIRELVDETTGKRVPPDNISGYAEAILWLHNHRETMRRLCLNARKRVESEFSTRAMTERRLNAIPAAGADSPSPQHWKIKTPLVVTDRLRFCLPGRLLRRLVFRLRRG